MYNQHCRQVLRARKTRFGRAGVNNDGGGGSVVQYYAFTVV